MGNRETIEALKAFVAERDWDQFHNIPNLAKSISIEAAELLEHFQWSDDFNQADVQDELADILTYCFLLAEKLGVSPEELIIQKLAKTANKYPVEKAKGRSDKYDQL